MNSGPSQFGKKNIFKKPGGVYDPVWQVPTQDDTVTEDATQVLQQNWQQWNAQASPLPTQDAEEDRTQVLKGKFAVPNILRPRTVAWEDVPATDTPQAPLSPPPSSFPGAGVGKSPFAPSAFSTPLETNEPPTGPKFTRALGQEQPTYRTGNTGSLPVPYRPLTGQLGNPEAGNTSALQLTGPVKVVKVPVAGQPGRYMTGILPVLPPAAEPAPRPRPEFMRKAQDRAQQFYRKYTRFVLIAGIAMVILFAFLLVFLTRPTSQSGLTVKSNLTEEQKQATAQAAVATQSAQEKNILTDPLKENVLGWQTGEKNGHQFFFKEGAYHISNNNSSLVAYATVPNYKVNTDMAYQVTLEQIKEGSYNSSNRVQQFYGIIFRFSQQAKDGKDVTTFFSFQVSTRDNVYEFRKFSNGSSGDPWTKLKSFKVGDEFKKGNNQKNTLKVVAKGDSFTFFVNDKQVGDEAKDNSFPEGSVGFFVNLPGTEIAFRDLSITRP